MEEKKPARKKPAKKKSEKTNFSHIKLFGKWDSDVKVNDIGIRGYINLEPRYLPRSAGIHRQRFHKSGMHIIERLATHLTVTGHTGKRHRVTSGKFGGRMYNSLDVVERALSIIEKKENKNPIQVLIDAIQNAAVREEIISYQLGSIIAREAVITAPQRRIDKALRFFAQGAYKKSFNKKKSFADALADEIIAAARGSGDSYAVKEKERIEREAGGAR
jgi:small subunit ribosomal protein S7